MNRKRITGKIFLIHPTRRQAIKLNQWMGSRRYFYNFLCLLYKKKLFEISTEAVAQYLISRLPLLQTYPKEIFLATYRHYQAALQRYKDKIVSHPPNFKNKDIRESVPIPQSLLKKFYISPDSYRIKILELNYTIPHDFDKSDSLPFQFTIKRTAEKYTLSFNQNKTLIDQLSPSRTEKIGIDLGVKRTIQTSQSADDFSQAPPNTNKQIRLFKRITRIYNYLRRTRDQLPDFPYIGPETDYYPETSPFAPFTPTRRRKKLKLKLNQLLHRKYRIQKDFCHRFSRYLTKPSSIKTIKFEDIKQTSLKDVSLPLRLAMRRQCWGLLKIFTKYKCESSSITYQEVPSQYTSQTCSKCGYKSASNRLTQETFSCKDCEHTENADYNAAKTIQKGLPLPLTEKSSRPDSD